MWTATGPITKTILPPAARMSRIIAAILPMLTSTRRSDEISLVMNAKPWRSRSRNSGTMRMPSLPQTMRSPTRTSRSLRHDGAAVLDDDDGVHALARDFDPAAAVADQRAVVGRRVEVLGRAAVHVGRPQPRVALGLRVAAERDQLLEQVGERRPRPAAVTFSRRREKSSLVRPMVKSRTSKALSCRMTASKMPVRICESTR